MSEQKPHPGMKFPVGNKAGRCTAYNPYNLEHIAARCVMGRAVEGHDLAATTGNALGLPVLIHRDADGQEWTKDGPYKRDARRVSESAEDSPESTG